MFNKLELNQELQIVRFGGDFKPLPDAFSDLEILVKENEDLYPGIDVWYERKVISGLKSSNRRAFVIYKNGKAVGAAVIKLGEDTKICSVRLTKEEQGRGIGHLLFSILAIEMRSHAKKVHFTAPESLWIGKNKFFDNLGFKFYGIANDQYRLWEDEFYCGTDFRSFWRNIVNTLPNTIANFTINGNSNRCDLVMSVKPEFAMKIFNGNKKMEVRRRFSSRWQEAKALIYASSPQRHFVGEVVIGNVFQAEPLKIWDTFKDDLGCSLEEYSRYCEGADKVYAITFTDAKKYKYSIPEIQIETLIQKELKAPQSYCEAKKGDVWPAAISMSCLLRAHLK